MIAHLENVTKQRDMGAGYRLHIRRFSVQEGESIAITGPSGCGKSTTLDLLGMVLRPDEAGTFVFSFDGKEADVAGLWSRGRTDALTDLRRRHLGYVLQTGGLFPFLTVEENVKLTALAAGMEPAQAAKRADALMERLGIARLRRAEPASLSIGERQRAAIARALAPQPRLLRADEPTAALDPGLSRTVMKLFLDVVRESGSSVVMVSHDVSLVHEFAFREVPVVVRSEGDHLSAFLDDQAGGR